MKVLLTGATGFLGSHLARALLAEGHQIVALKRSTSDLWRLSDIAEQIEFHNLEGLDLETPFKQHERIDAVIHTATCYGRKGETATEIFEANTAFPLSLLQMATLFNTDTFFNTDTILSAHLNQYALSKKQFADWGRMLCGAGPMRFVNIRLEHMYGPGDDPSKFTSWIIQECLKHTELIDLTHGEQKRDFVYIDDVVSAYLLLLQTNPVQHSEPIEVGLGSGRAIRVRAFVEAVHTQTKSKSRLNFGAIEYRTNEILNSCSDTSYLEHLGWKPTISLNEGLHKTIEQSNAKLALE